MTRHISVEKVTKRLYMKLRSKHPVTEETIQKIVFEWRRGEKKPETVVEVLIYEKLDKLRDKDWTVTP